MRVVYLGLGDGRHSVELLKYLNPPGRKVPPVNRIDVGATHLGFIVEGLEELYQELNAKGVSFLTPPAYREIPSAFGNQRLCLLQDPDGNWLEFLERAPVPLREPVS